ncbi:MAG: NADH-ubiquinone oxidoreductase-F iron-sulfur binding region domain-containing protein [Hyphomonadaceae bacterium]
MGEPVRIFVSRDSAALSVGADDVAQAILEEAARRKQSVTIIRTGSRGLLWLEPMVEVQTSRDRIAYGPTDPSDVSSLFDADWLSGGSHGLRLGPLESLPFFANQERLVFARCGLTDPLDLQSYEQHGGLSGLRQAAKRRPADVIEEVSKAGLRGRGGAGFPAGRKWSTVAAASGARKYICCNADEGDSGTFADRMLLEGDPFVVLEGMTIAAHAVGADEAYIYIRSEYPAAIKVLGEAVAIWQAAALNQIAGRTVGFHIRRGAGAYICGEESSMLQSIEGKRGEVRAKPPLPAIAGLFGMPTVVNNVLTLASVPWILANGASAYAKFGAGNSRGTQAFQLAGDVARGGLVEKAFGVTARELVEVFGGGTRSGRPVKAVMTGGPLGAYLSCDDLDVSMDYEALQSIGGMLGHGGVVVFNDATNMARMARFAMEFCAAESCGKCTPCRVGAVRGMETLDRIINGVEVSANLALLEDLCEVMTDGSLCAMGGLTPAPVRSAIKRFPDDFLRNKDNSGQRGVS